MRIKKESLDCWQLCGILNWKFRSYGLVRSLAHTFALDIRQRKQLQTLPNATSHSLTLSSGSAPYNQFKTAVQIRYTQTHTPKRNWQKKKKKNITKPRARVETDKKNVKYICTHTNWLISGKMTAKTVRNVKQNWTEQNRTWKLDILLIPRIQREVFKRHFTTVDLHLKDTKNINKLLSVISKEQKQKPKKK